MWNYKTFGIPDEEFIRGKVPMTKEEVRTITISKLRLQEDHTVVDIGAGTGSLSIEAALVCKRGRVISIERKEEGIDLIKKNMEKFHINNLIPINGKAIEALNDIDFFHRAIIGGSGGQLEEIVRMCHEKLVDGGILVVNAITIETLYNSIKFMEKEGFEKIETICVNISRGDKLGNYTLMKGLNPIYIITGRK
jgi:cobalt-precorrin-6B (C15)-methyltransferase